MSINSVDLLSIQKDNTWDREEWIVPLSVALQSVTAEQAEWTPPGGGNSIRETVNHINYYNKRILNRLKNIPSVPGVQTNEETFSNLEHPAGAEGWIDFGRNGTNRVRASPSHLRTEGQRFAGSLLGEIRRGKARRGIVPLAAA